VIRQVKRREVEIKAGLVRKRKALKEEKRD
jgi:hypothetical protein